MIAYADLGGLGAREGTPVKHTWEPPPPAPPRIFAVVEMGTKILATVLLLLLPLFLFRPNRTAAAWWIWVPVVIALLVTGPLAAQMINADDSILQAVYAFLVGLAAVWLLMPYLASGFRILMFLKTVPVLAGFSLLAFVPTLLGRSPGWLDFRSVLAGMLAFAGLAATLAFVLSGLSVRRRFGRVRIVLWLVLWLVLAWIAIAAPFALFSLLGSRPDLGEFLIAILVVSGIMLALIIPFLLLAFFQPFYRSRFAAWLNLPQPASVTGTSLPASSADADQITANPAKP